MGRNFASKKNRNIGAASLAAIVISIVIYLGNIGISSPSALNRNANVSNQDVKGLRVSIIDVWQGDSILVQCNSETMLIDAGKNNEGSKVVDYLSKSGIKKLDVVVGTHPHEDHIGGMDQVIDSFEIGKVIMPETSNNTKSFESVLDSIDRKGLNISGAVAGQTFKLGGADIIVLGPVENNYEDLNDSSVVLKLIYGKRAFLFTADGGIEAESDIINSGVDLKADVLKVGHHGSKYSTSKEFLELVNPEFGAISVGDGNDYKHPADDTIKRLNEAGIEIYRTDRNGNIVFTSDGDTLTIKTEK